MEAIFSIIVEIIYISVLRFPGAGIRWLFIRKRKSFQELLKEDNYYNAGVSLIFIIIIIVVVYWIK